MEGAVKIVRIALDTLRRILDIIKLLKGRRGARSPRGEKKRQDVIKQRDVIIGSILITIVVCVGVYLFAGCQSTKYVGGVFSVESIILVISTLIELFKRNRPGYVGVGLACFIVLGAFGAYSLTYNRPSIYVDTSVPKEPGITNILPIVVLDLEQVPPERDFVLENLIRHEIADCGFYPQGNFFKECFFEEGHFLDIYDGRSQMLIRLEIHKLVDYLFLAERSKEVSPPDPTIGVISCRVYLMYEILHASGRHIPSGTASATGAGFTEAAAETRAYELVAEQICEVLGSL